MKEASEGASDGLTLEALAEYFALPQSELQNYGCRDVRVDGHPAVAIPCCDRGRRPDAGGAAPTATGQTGRGPPSESAGRAMQGHIRRREAGSWEYTIDRGPRPGTTLPELRQEVLGRASPQGALSLAAVVNSSSPTSAAARPRVDSPRGARPRRR